MAGSEELEASQEGLQPAQEPSIEEESTTENNGVEQSSEVDAETTPQQQEQPAQDEAAPPPTPEQSQEQSQEGPEQKGRFIKWLFGENQGGGQNAEAGGLESEFGAGPGAQEQPPPISDGQLQRALLEMGQKITALTNQAQANNAVQKNLQGTLQKLQQTLGKEQETTLRRLDRLYEAIRLVAAELRQILTLTQQHVQNPPAVAESRPQGAAAVPPQSAGPPEPDPAWAKDPEHKKARRIANAMVSDLEAYNRQKLEESVKQGTTIQVLEKAINDMRAAYQRRVSERVQKEYDYLTETLATLLARKRKELTGSESPPPNTPDHEFEMQRGGAAAPASAGSSGAMPAAGSGARPAAGQAAAAPPLNPNVVLSGRIYKEFLPDLIQQLSQNMETGIFRIFPKGAAEDECLEVFFIEGDIYNCTSPDGEGEKAFFEAIQVKEGRFEFELNQNESVERKIQGQTSFLVLEAFKQQDESAVGRRD